MEHPTKPQFKTRYINYTYPLIFKASMNNLLYSVNFLREDERKQVRGQNIKVIRTIRAWEQMSKGIIPKEL